LAIAEGWHRGPSVKPIDDPTKIGAAVTEMLKTARPNAGMDGKDGSYPQNTIGKK
jgi:hypothetical protein